MLVREVTARAADARDLATRLLQRARLADPTGGIWEAADVQWWWRQPRDSDSADQVFWVDDHGPVAAVLLTSWRADRWQCDTVTIPDGGEGTGPPLERLLTRARSLLRQARGTVELNLRPDDSAARPLVDDLGLLAQGQWTVNWMDAAHRPTVRGPADGYQITDHRGHRGVVHPMSTRNGQQIADRLGQCDLYDPALDLAVRSADGEVAGYALFWFDPHTRVGYIEPVRAEAGHQRQGLATALLTEGLDRLARYGATRFKILNESPAAAALYQGIGCRPHIDVSLYTGSAPGN